MKIRIEKGKLVGEIQDVDYPVDRADLSWIRQRRAVKKELSEYLNKLRSIVDAL